MFGQNTTFKSQVHCCTYRFCLLHDIAVYMTFVVFRLLCAAFWWPTLVNSSGLLHLLVSWPALVNLWPLFSNECDRHFTTNWKTNSLLFALKQQNKLKVNIKITIASDSFFSYGFKIFRNFTSLAAAPCAPWKRVPGLENIPEHHGT